MGIRAQIEKTACYIVSDTKRSCFHVNHVLLTMAHSSFAATKTCEPCPVVQPRDVRHALSCWLFPREEALHNLFSGFHAHRTLTTRASKNLLDLSDIYAELHFIFFHRMHIIFTGKSFQVKTVLFLINASSHC